MELLIIGTDPPCPRCDRTAMMAEQIIKDSGADCTIRMLDLYSEEAVHIAEANGRKIGTTNEISGASGVMVDRKAFAEAVLKASEGKDENCRPGELWSPAFDEALDAVSKAAEHFGYYMTPVILIGGELLWHGSVPPEEELRKWITEKAG